MADRDVSKTTRRVRLGCFALLWATSLPFALFPLGLGLRDVSNGDAGGWVLVATGLILPFVVLGLVAIPSLIGSAIHRARGGRDYGHLDALQAALGGEVTRGWRVAQMPTLRTSIDGERVRIVAEPLARVVHAEALRAVIERPHAKAGVAGLGDAQRLRISMYSNHRSPVDLSLVTRSGVSGWTARISGMSEVTLPAHLTNRVAVYSQRPQQAAQALAVPGVLPTLIEVVEANPPFISQLLLATNGTHFATTASDATGPEGLQWRHRRIRWVVEQLVAVSPVAHR